MKKILLLSVVAGIFSFISSLAAFSQDEHILPSIIRTGVYHGLTPPLKDLPVVTEEEFQQMAVDASNKIFNQKVRERAFPYSNTALPTGPDPVWQKEQGTSLAYRDMSLIFDGLTTPYWPTDANGSVGHNHYMQAVNCMFAIYDKTSGALVAGPTFMHHLFSGVIGSECNSGDPVVIYDEYADRWVATEMSICGENDYVLVAVSASSDPTGSWYRYSFDVDDVPDYEKIAVWQDGYYMATNNGSGEDIFVFDRTQMLLGGLNPTMYGFDNQWRPVTSDGFHVVLPLDNDGPIAPGGSPGLFITMNDDAVGGGSDQLWIYELIVDWENLENTTFFQTETIDTDPFDSNFGPSSNGIPQPKPGKDLDALPNFLMHRAQYRNFGTYEAIVCCHTVDVDGSNTAGIRWYELRRENSESDWTIRQQGTFAPNDGLSRWMGSIAMNGNHEIGLGYSVSSSQEYPGIRYCGQSAEENDKASGEMDVTEEIIHTGTLGQGMVRRWGDYWNMAIDPDNDNTFWFTAQYCGDHLQTKIAAFDFTPPVLLANFTAEPIHVWTGNSVSFTDRSNGTPTTWEWTFPGGNPNSYSYQFPPVIEYSTSGYYDVTLEVSDASTTTSTTKTTYITVEDDSYCTSHGNAVEEWIQYIGSKPYSSYASGSSGAIGYQDLRGLIYDMEPGVPKSFQANVGFSSNSKSEYWRFWIDLNQNESFEDPGEEVLAVNAKKSGFTATITIPTTASAGITRMRVAMKRGSAPGPCEAFEYGEVEDFTVNILAPVPQPPVANFTAEETTIAPGNTVIFNDLSTNTPTSWSWTFPGGSPETSTEKDPDITYNDIGNYDVTLMVANDVGSDIITKTAYIIVSEDPVSAYCEPTAINNATYYINDIIIDGQNGEQGQTGTGYMYYNDPFFTLAPGNVSVELIPNNTKRKFFWKIWFDANNDSYFDDENETLLTVNNAKGTISQQISVPIFTDPGRLRICMKLGSAPAPCDDNFKGEVEDYNVVMEGFNPISHDTEKKTLNVEIYPNPVSGNELFMNFSKLDAPLSIQIYEKNGRLVQNLQSEEEQLIVNISEYNDGFYYVKITDGVEVVVKKIVKLH